MFTFSKSLADTNVGLHFEKKKPTNFLSEIHDHVIKLIGLLIITFGAISLP